MTIKETVLIGLFYIVMFVLVAIMASCATTSQSGPQVLSRGEPPAAFMGAELATCFVTGSGINACGYGFLPEGPRGDVCFHVLVRNPETEEWFYFKTKCYDQTEKKDA
jgi:hypothetical protein